MTNTAPAPTAPYVGQTVTVEAYGLVRQGQVVRTGRTVCHVRITVAARRGREARTVECRMSDLRSRA